MLVVNVRGTIFVTKFGLETIIFDSIKWFTMRTRNIRGGSNKIGPGGPELAAKMAQFLHDRLLS